MRNVAFFLLFALVAGTVSGAQVLWDAFTQVEYSGRFEGWPSEIKWEWIHDDGMISPFAMSYFFTVQDFEWMFSSTGPGGFSGTVYQASQGEVVDFAHAESVTPVFEYLGGRRWPFPETVPVKGRNGDEFYLAVMLDYGEESIYGWLQFLVSQQGQLSLVHSAIDLDGGPMVVGGGSATPEPSGALLLLLGLGALGLRRPRSTVHAISLRTVRAAPRRNPLRRTLPQGRMK